MAFIHGPGALKNYLFVYHCSGAERAKKGRIGNKLTAATNRCKVKKKGAVITQVKPRNSLLHLKLRT